MDICDEKNKDIYVETLLHAPAQPRKGVIYGNSRIIIYEHLWLIDGHFWLKEQKHLCRNIASCASPTPKGVYLWTFKKDNSWTFMAHWWTFLTKRTKTFMSKQCANPTPKGVYLWNFKNYNSWTFMAHWWTFVTKKTKTFMSKNKNIFDEKNE